MNITAATPLPLRLTICGLFDALSAILSEPLLIPKPEGEKVTLTVHFPLGTMVALLQLLEAKFVVAVMLVITRLTDPVLVIDRLRVPTAPTTTLPKLIVVADKVAICATAVSGSRIRTTVNSNKINRWRCFIGALSIAT